MKGQLVWYVARAAGLVAWVLLTASVLWGLAISTGIMRGRPRPAWLLDLHRYLGGLATIFSAVHIAAIVGDTYVHFGVASILVPFAGRWHPVAVAWGVVALYLLLAVEVTSLVRRRLPRTLWRATHVASFPLFVFATVHGISAGTDGRGVLAVGVAACATLAIAALTAHRISRPRERAPAAGLTAPLDSRLSFDARVLSNTANGHEHR